MINFLKNIKIRKVFKNFLPPIIPIIYRRLTSKYNFCGEYKSWQDAQNKSSGYASEHILEKTKNALLKVKNGEAVYERDSYIFNKIQYSWPLLSTLLYVSLIKNSELNILDFGGSLGSSYFQNKLFLQSIKKIKWNIVEQELFVICGNKYFKDASLSFYKNTNECLLENSPALTIFSNSLQYLPKPYEALSEIFKNKMEYILIDKLPLNHKKDLITVQNVNPEIYDASYPLWIFKEESILNYFSNNGYELLYDFNVPGLDFIIRKTKFSGEYKGYLFRIKRS